MKEIYLVSKLWTDAMENRDAIGYEPVGFISSKEALKLKIKSFIPDCWAAFGKEYPEYKLEKILNVYEKIK